MIPMTVNNLLLTMAVCLFGLGIISIGAGVFILLARVMGEDLKTISNQTALLAKKGFAEDVSGLVGNASELVSALNELVRTTSGVGIFLILIGFILLLGAYYLVLQITI